MHLMTCMNFYHVKVFKIYYEDTVRGRNGGSLVAQGVQCTRNLVGLPQMMTAVV